MLVPGEVDSAIVAIGESLLQRGHDTEDRTKVTLDGVSVCIGPIGEQLVDLGLALPRVLRRVDVDIDDHAAGALLFYRERHAKWIALHASHPADALDDRRGAADRVDE